MHHSCTYKNVEPYVKCMRFFCLYIFRHHPVHMITLQTCRFDLYIPDMAYQVPLWITNVSTLTSERSIIYLPKKNSNQSYVIFWQNGNRVHLSSIRGWVSHIDAFFNPLSIPGALRNRLFIIYHACNAI